MLPRIVGCTFKRAHSNGKKARDDVLPSLLALSPVWETCRTLDGPGVPTERVEGESSMSLQDAGFWEVGAKTTRQGTRRHGSREKDKWVEREYPVRYLARSILHFSITQTQRSRCEPPKIPLSNKILPFCLIGSCLSLAERVQKAVQWTSSMRSSVSAASVCNVRENPCIYWGKKKKQPVHSDGRKPIPNSRSPSSDTLRQLFAGWRSNEELSRWRGEARGQRDGVNEASQQGPALIASSQHERLFRVRPCVFLFVQLNVLLFISKKGTENERTASIRKENSPISVRKRRCHRCNWKKITLRCVCLLYESLPSTGHGSKAMKVFFQ